jgi:hypothetical protein
MAIAIAMTINTILTTNIFSYCIHIIFAKQMTGVVVWNFD